MAGRRRLAVRRDRLLTALCVAAAFPGALGFFGRPRSRVNSAGGAPLPPARTGCGLGEALGQLSRSSPLCSTVMDGPSDVESVVVDVEVEEVPPRTPRVVSEGGPKEQWKDQLMDLLMAGGLLSNTGRKRAKINELLLRLEAVNPTPSPAYSPLLNGPWTFLYTGGISPGLLGLQLVGLLASSGSGAIELGETQLTISRAQPRAEVSTLVRIFGREQSFKIRTRVEVESDITLRETYVEAETGQLKVPFPEKGPFERRLHVAYLDDDLLIVRDSFGAPDILIRKSRPAVPYGVPSATDDDAAPGAG